MEEQPYQVCFECVILYFTYDLLYFDRRIFRAVGLWYIVPLRNSRPPRVVMDLCACRENPAVNDTDSALDCRRTRNVCCRIYIFLS